MFSTLFYSVFPVLGEFFGRLAGYASISVNTFLAMLAQDSSVAVKVANVFNGDIITLTAIPQSVGGTVAAVVLTPVRWFIKLIVNISGVSFDIPLWSALLLCAVSLALIIGIFKFMFNLIDLLPLT